MGAAAGAAFPPGGKAIWILAVLAHSACRLHKVFKFTQDISDSRCHAEQEDTTGHNQNQSPSLYLIYLSMFWLVIKILLSLLRPY